jgi:hypothetical protein
MPFLREGIKNAIASICELHNVDHFIVMIDYATFTSVNV